MAAFEQVARPVIFEHEDDRFPYWTKGSSVLLATSEHYYWLTAAHVVGNAGVSMQALRIFPSDQSRISLPFNEQYLITTGPHADDEYRDVFALRIDLAEFSRFGDAPLIAQDVDRGLLPPEALVPGNELWVVGYPAESCAIDYDLGQITNTRSVIRAIYRGPSILDHCHEATVDSSISLSSYDGLSGSPVFYMRSARHEGNEILFPQVVGMLLRGTASSGLLHFVSARVLGEIVAIASSGAKSDA